MAPRILVVDDERGIANSLRVILTISGYECEAVYNAADAMAVIDSFNPQLVITDVVMPEMTGIEMALKLRESRPTLSVILLSGNAVTQELLSEAGDLASMLVLPKPYSPPDLLKVVAHEIAKVHAA